VTKSSKVKSECRSCIEHVLWSSNALTSRWMLCALKALMFWCWQNGSATTPRPRHRTCCLRRCACVVHRIIMSSLERRSNGTRCDVGWADGWWPAWPPQTSTECIDLLLAADRPPTQRGSLSRCRDQKIHVMTCIRRSLFVAAGGGATASAGQQSGRWSAVTAYRCALLLKAGKYRRTAT